MAVYLVISLPKIPCIHLHDFSQPHYYQLKMRGCTFLGQYS